MKYVNLDTQKVLNSLPTRIVIDGSATSNLNGVPFVMCKEVGWREIENPTPDADAGYVRTSGYTYSQDPGDPDAALVAFDQITQAAYDAQVAAQAEASADAESNPTNFQRQVRAVIELVVDEINTLRVEHSLPARTGAQVKAALRNKLDAM